MGENCSKCFKKNEEPLSDISVSKPNDNKSKKTAKTFQNKNNRLIIACLDTFLYEFSIDKKKITRTIKSLNAYASSIIISPRKLSFCVITIADELYQLDLSTNKCIRKIKDANCKKMAQTYDGRYLITSSDFKIIIRSSRNYKILKSFIVYSAPFYMVCSYDSKFLFIGHLSGFLSVIDIQNFRPIAYLKANEDSIYCMVVLRDNRHIIVSG